MKKNLNTELSDYQFIAKDMLIYIKHKDKQIEANITLEENFDKKTFEESKQRWVAVLSEAVDAFNNNNDDLIEEFMIKVYEIENEVFSLVSDD